MLQDVIKILSKKIEVSRRKDLDESNTKGSLVEPLFKEIGWDFEDFDSVQREFPVYLEGEKKPADYALKFEEKVCVFLEAKRIKEKIDVAIKDGTAKAIKENVPWLIATNGDAIAVWMIEQTIPEEERAVFQVSLSDSVQNEQTLNQFMACLQLLNPENIQSGVLKSFAEQKLKETRITNVLKTTLETDDFRELIQNNYSEIYLDDKLDQDVLDKVIQEIRISEGAEPIPIETPVEDPNSPKFQTRRKKLFQYPGKREKESTDRNIKNKRELWLEFIERKRMSTPEFKDYAQFKDQGTGGFSSFLTYWGLATNDGRDKVRNGDFFKINEVIIPDIKAILDVK